VVPRGVKNLWTAVAEDPSREWITAAHKGSDGPQEMTKEVGRWKRSNNGERVREEMEESVRGRVQREEMKKLESGFRSSMTGRSS
jgi:hypothetical protein